MDHEAGPCHLAGREHRGRGGWLRCRGRHVDPDLPGFRPAHDVGEEPEDGRGVHGGEHGTLLSPTTTIPRRSGCAVHDETPAPLWGGEMHREVVGSVKPR